eukprot:TRINITY_DN18061_c0_g2_i1.p1 TRINITY_DN18061_c0_g2~~TRINITY_DN18061_c0_g2_i1.p1  ORF type:complete len:142 (-),score=37.47 TRINITY_DN18061_c0_g2_i1:97-522(-)
MPYRRCRPSVASVGYFALPMHRALFAVAFEFEAVDDNDVYLPCNGLADPRISQCRNDLNSEAAMLALIQIEASAHLHGQQQQKQKQKQKQQHKQKQKQKQQQQESSRKEDRYDTDTLRSLGVGSALEELGRNDDDEFEAVD